MAISKGTAAVLILLIMGGAAGAIAMIVRKEHAKEERGGRGFVKEIGPCVRRSAREAIELAGIERAKSFDGTNLDVGHHCYEPAEALAKRSHASPSAVAALRGFATVAMDFEKAALDVELYVGHGKKKMDSAKGRRLAAAAAMQRDSMISAEAKLSAYLGDIYADEVAHYGTLTATQRGALAIAVELEALAGEASNSVPDQDKINASVAKITTLAGRDAELQHDLARWVPWLAEVHATGVLPAGVDPDVAPRSFWDAGVPL